MGDGGDCRDLGGRRWENEAWRLEGWLRETYTSTPTPILDCADLTLPYLAPNRLHHSVVRGNRLVRPSFPPSESLPRAPKALL